MKTIIIVGGGLAGLALGIGLRQRGIPVTIWEAGRYPRHRVCGEFISGRGEDVLARLGLRDAFFQAGACAARTAALSMGKTGSPVRPLPTPALCLSRFTMDALLARLFRERGGELRDNERWRPNGSAEAIVRASGRRLQSRAQGWRWFGLKAHARNAALVADLEMHTVHDGYVGLCRLNSDVVNVCGLFRRRTGTHEPAQPWNELLRGAPGTSLHQRLADARFDESSFCSVAGLALHPQRALALTDCCIGDALTMIPPVTGNGMSMALEASELAIAPLTAFGRGDLSWQQTRQAIARACDQAFAQRLAWARLLQWMMFTPALRGALASVVLRSDWLWQTMFARTR